MLVRRKLTQKQLLTYAANLQACLIGLEACSGAHFLGRVLREQGAQRAVDPCAVREAELRSEHGWMRLNAGLIANCSSLHLPTSWQGLPRAVLSSRDDYRPHALVVIPV